MSVSMPAVKKERFEITTDNLKQLGLSDVDIGEIHEVAKRIDPSNPLSVAEFGREVSDFTASYSDDLLEQVRNSDLDDAGAKLTEVVSIARSLNVGPLSDSRSRIPVVGPLVDRIRLKTANVMSTFDSTRVQIDALIKEVSTTQESLAARNTSLETMFSAVREEHRKLGIHIAAGKLRVYELDFTASRLRDEIDNDPSLLQELSDLDTLVNNLDKRIGDLSALQHSAMQSLPTIRMIQANNQMLVDKFHTINEVTVPAWKRQFMLALSLNEQRNAVQLAKSIDDTTNDLLTSNAKLLHRNSVETAKANQRLVIDVSTLKTVQDTLINTVQDVLRIQQDGVAARKQAEAQISAMRIDLRNRLANKEVAVETMLEAS